MTALGWATPIDGKLIGVILVSVGVAIILVGLVVEYVRSRRREPSDAEIIDALLPPPRDPARTFVPKDHPESAFHEISRWE